MRSTITYKRRAKACTRSARSRVNRLSPTSRGKIIAASHPRSPERRAKRDDRVLSYTTFTEPQLARTGLSEEQARAAGYTTRTTTLALENVARGTEWNLEAGFYRLVVDAKTDKILGATFIGYEAGEIIHTIAFSIELGATWRDLDRFMAIHPTFGEGLPSLARQFETQQ